MTTVILNGLPGRMASEIAAVALSNTEIAIAPVALCGPSTAQRSVTLGSNTIALIPPQEREQLAHEIKGGAAIAIDFTTPDAARPNIEFYCAHQIPFVMGTSGFDRSGIEALVRSSGISAVIAPNMGLPLIVLQAMLEYAAHEFPGALSGYSLKISESHQASKRDTSGTAKAFVHSFNQLGIPFSTDQIEMIRDPQAQRALGIPETALGGHAWHNYSLASSDNTVKFELSHKVNGRRVYADGALRAACFLSRRIGQGARGVVYSMIDVAREQ